MDILKEPATAIFRVESETVRKDAVKVKREEGRCYGNWAVRQE
jgi:hypothetical protein